MDQSRGAQRRPSRDPARPPTLTRAGPLLRGRTAAFTTADTYANGTSGQNTSIVADPLTADTYTYVNGDPLNFADPSGHAMCQRAAADDDDALTSCGRGQAVDSQGYYSGRTSTGQRYRDTYLRRRQADANAICAQTGEADACERNYTYVDYGAIHHQLFPTHHSWLSNLINGAGGVITTSFKTTVNIVGSGGAGLVNGLSEFATLGQYNPHLTACAFGDSHTQRTICHVSNDVGTIGGVVAPALALSIATGGEAAPELLDMAEEEVATPAEEIGAPAGEDPPVVIGENMEERVQPYADSVGGETYQPDPTAPRESWEQNQRDWINKQMDDSRTIHDCGPDPARANYPNITSPWYGIEKGEIANRRYPVIPVEC